MIESIVPLDAEHDKTRQRLLDAAEIVFAEKGFEAASVREICACAGVKNIGAVNYYFHGKERLYLEAVQQAFGCCTEGAPFPEEDPNATAVDRLAGFIRVMVTRMMDIPRPESMKLMMREMTEPTEACRDAVRANIEPMAHALKRIVEKLAPDLNEERVWLVGFSVVGQCLYYRQSRTIAEMLMGKEAFEQLSVDTLSAHITAFSLAAMGLGNPVTSK
jgi:TetR/AcrR family transcriptional regulator, regulator of cefoperazone and chloramphenicol sensitivity